MLNTKEYDLNYILSSTENCLDYLYIILDENKPTKSEIASLHKLLKDIDDIKYKTKQALINELSNSIQVKRSKL